MKIKTSGRCQGCGQKIPPLPVPDAFCVKCRYTAGQKAKPCTAPNEFDIALASDTRTDDPPPPRDCEDIEDILLGAGLPAPPEVVKRLDSYADLRTGRKAYTLAGDALKHLAVTLPLLTAEGYALRRILTGDKTPIRAAAKQAKCSPSALFKAQTRLSAWMKKNKFTP